MMDSQWTIAGVWIAALGFMGLLIRQLVPWRKQSSDAAEHLRGDLLRRVSKLERALDRERLIHSAERSLDRHRLNNVTQCFDALLLLVEMNPEKAAEAVQKIKDMRAYQILAETREKAAIIVAEIAADGEESRYSKDGEQQT